jgi:hydroxyacylglutathione hydrolase
MTKKLSRRHFLYLGGAVAGATILPSCAKPTPSPAPTSAPVTQPTTAPLATGIPSTMEPTAAPPVTFTPIQVSPHLYRVAGGLPSNPAEIVVQPGDLHLALIEVCDVYLVLTPDPVLIECGSPLGWDQLMGSLKSLNIQPGNIRWVIGTHGHYDHIENIALFQQQYPQVKFALHAADAQFVVDDDRVFSCAETLYQGHASAPKKVDRLLLDGDQIQVGENTFQIIHTPGHTPGSIVIMTQIDGKVVAFCGDAIGGLYSSINRSNVIDFENSFRRLMHYEFDLLIMGNGDARFGPAQYGPILKMGLENAEEKREQQRGDESYELLCKWW